MYSIFADSFFDDLFDWTGHVRRFAYPSAPFPQLNIYEDESSFHIVAELPGLRKEDLAITVKNRTLSIEGKRVEKESAPREYYRRERARGEFKRTISLSDLVDTGSINAELKNGILTITLAKSGELKPREITIN